MKGFAFPKSSRLLKSDDFGRVLAKTEKTFRVYSAYFSAGCLVNPTTSTVRIGITVGKKNVPRAVDRALIKRAIREHIRQVLPEIQKSLSIKGSGLDIVVRIKTPLKQIELSHQKQPLKRALNQDLTILLERLSPKIQRCV